MTKEKEEYTRVELGEMLADAQEGLETCLLFIEDEFNKEASAKLTRLLVKRASPISDRLHERVVRSNLFQYPFRKDLTRTLIQLLFKSGRPPFPDLAMSGGEPPEALDDLIDEGAAQGRKDRLGRYVAFWQAIVQYPHSPRGWSALSFCLAEDRSWEDARQAIGRAVEKGATTDVLAAADLVRSINVLIENKEIGDFDCLGSLSGMPPEIMELPEALSILVHLGSPTARTVMPKMLEVNKTSWKACLIGGLAAFNEGRFVKGYEHVRNAFERNPSATLREITAVYPQMDRLLNQSGLMEELASWLEQLTTSEPIDILISLSPSFYEVERCRSLRQLAIDRGLPSVYLATMAKSGSVTIGNIFNSGFDLPTAVYSLLSTRIISPWLHEYQRGGACYVTHLYASRENVARLVQANVSKMIVHVRDPRQVAVSLFEHYRKYPEQLPADQRAQYHSASEQQLDILLRVGFFHTIEFLTAWVNARASMKVEFTFFEDFLRSPSDFVENIIDIYGGDKQYFNHANALGEHKGVDAHIRLGSADEWRTRLNREQVNALNDAMPPDFWSIFGWKE